MNHRPPGKVLSVLVEKSCSEVKRLRSVDVFDETTGPVFANLLNTPGLCDLLSAVRECPLGGLLGRSSWFVKQARKEEQIFSQGPADFGCDAKGDGGKNGLPR